MLAALSSGGCGGYVILHAPAIAPSEARVRAARVDVEPIATRPGALAASTADVGHPAPAAIITAAMQAELAGRALEGGDEGGYRARCTLDRFALRVFFGFASTNAVATLYVDLACSVARIEDDVDVWRGALRGRAAARTTSAMASEGDLVQRLADRAVSDATREMASDLAVRVLALGGAPSARVFASEELRGDTAGVDDSAFGAAALTEAPDRIPAFLPSIRDLERSTRAAAWNAIAMAVGPGDPWTSGEIALDDEPFVRFYQYKALAREASPGSLAQLRRAAAREREEWLVEMVKDALVTGGLGLARRR